MAAQILDGLFHFIIWMFYFRYDLARMLMFPELPCCRVLAFHGRASTPKPQVRPAVAPTL